MYIPYYDREGEREETVVGTEDAREVLDDYIGKCQDDGEWFPSQDGWRDLRHVANGDCEYIEFTIRIGVKAEEKRSFWLCFYRLIVLEVINDQIGYFRRDGGEVVRCKIEATVMEKDFYEQALNLLPQAPGKDEAINLLHQFEQQEKQSAFLGSE